MIKLMVCIRLYNAKIALGLSGHEHWRMAQNVQNKGNKAQSRAVFVEIQILVSSE